MTNKESYPALIDLTNRLKEEGRQNDSDICSKALYCLNRMYKRHFKHVDRIHELEAAFEDERERCAKIAERFLSNNEPVRLTASSIAAAIRENK